MVRYVSRRGYMALTITPTKVSNDWLFVDSIKTKSANAIVGHTATVMHGRNRDGLGADKLQAASQESTWRCGAAPARATATAIAKPTPAT